MVATQMAKSDARYGVEVVWTDVDEDLRCRKRLQRRPLTLPRQLQKRPVQLPVTRQLRELLRTLSASPANAHSTAAVRELRGSRLVRWRAGGTRLEPFLRRSVKLLSL